MRWPLLLGLCLAACDLGDGPEDTGGRVVDDIVPDDSATPSDDSATITDDTGKGCTLAVLTSAPGDGDATWLYTDPIVVHFNGAAKGATLALVDGAGTAVAFTPTWSLGGLELSVTATLEPSATYTLTVTTCGETTDVDFTTSAYGEPLTIQPAELVGRTYLFDLATADYSEPASIGTLLSNVVTADLLLGVTAADAKSIEFLGAQGYADGGGTYHQAEDRPTYPFPMSDFTDQPFASATTAAMQIEQSGALMTLYDFSMAGMFAADGTSIGGATITAKVDTTNLGPALKLADEPMAVCDFLGLMEIACVSCPTGTYDNCLPIDARIDVAPVVPGLTLVAK